MITTERRKVLSMLDEQIIELFFNRSGNAIDELDKKYGKVLHKLSYNILNDRLDVEECLNDSYLGVWNTIPPERPNPLLRRLPEGASRGRPNNTPKEAFLSARNRPSPASRENFRDIRTSPLRAHPSPICTAGCSSGRYPDSAY